MTDLIRKSDALAACQGMDPEGDINNLPAVTVGVPTDCRKWPFYPIQMPTTKDGKGPATIGVDAASVSYEVWDWEFNTYASFEHLPDAINEAMRLSLAALEPVAAPDPAAIREAALERAANETFGVKREYGQADTFQSGVAAARDRILALIAKGAAE